MLQFYDESGVNNLPVGLQVLVYPNPGAQTPATLVGSAWTQPGGLADISVSPAVNYVAVFVGSQAPPNQQTFTGSLDDTTVVTVAAYKSPTLTQLGYTQAQVNGWVRKWFGDAAGLPGGNAYALASGLGAVLASADSSTQYELARVRVQSSTGPDIDSWFSDFLGVYLQRYDEEGDDAFLMRGLAMLVSPKCTLAAIQGVVTAFYTATALESGEAQSQNLTFDGQGGFDSWGALDSSFGFADAAIPYINVSDRQSRPDLANLYNVNPNNNDGTFVIQVGTSPENADAWYLDRTHLDHEAVLLNIGSYAISATAPDPRLAALINFVKAGGTKPLYAVYQAA